MKAELVPENGDPPIPITRDVTVVGRREYCDVAINHPSLSKRHCVLVKTDGLLVIRDLATTNGTKVKGQRIRWAALLPDDRITLGAYKLRVYLGPDDALGPSEMARWAGGKGKAPAASSAQPPKGKTAVPAPMPVPARPESKEFSAPSPLGTPAVAPTPAGVWEADEDEGDVQESRWQDLVLPRVDPDDDVLIELD
jgi:predicted component of type VI protein secretion system